jgi:hypothetical protein
MNVHALSKEKEKEEEKKKKGLIHQTIGNGDSAE